MTICKSIHVATNGIILFYFFYSGVSFISPLWASLYHVFIHFTANGHLDYLHVLDIVYSVAMSTGVHVSFRVMVFSGYMPKKWDYRIIWDGKYNNMENQRRRQQKMRWLDSIMNSMYMNMNKLWEIVKNREAWCAAVHEVAKGWAWFSDWTAKNDRSIFSF